MSSHAQVILTAVAALCALGALLGAEAGAGELSDGALVLGQAHAARLAAQVLGQEVWPRPLRLPLQAGRGQSETCSCLTTCLGLGHALRLRARRLGRVCGAGPEPRVTSQETYC